MPGAPVRTSPFGPVRPDAREDPVIDILPLQHQNFADGIAQLRGLRLVQIPLQHLRDERFDLEPEPLRVLMARRRRHLGIPGCERADVAIDFGVDVAFTESGLVRRRLQPVARTQTRRRWQLPNRW